MFRLGSQAPVAIKPESFNEKAQKLQEYIFEQEEKKKLEEKQIEEDADIGSGVGCERQTNAKLEKSIEELKEFIENKIKKIDEVVEYIQSNQKLQQNPVQTPQPAFQPIQSIQPIQQQVVELPNEQLKTQPTKIVPIPKQKKKKTYFEMTDSRFNIVKAQFPELEMVDRTDLYSDGEIDYVRIGNKKVPINYKAILQLEKKRKSRGPAKQEAEKKES